MALNWGGDLRGKRLNLDALRTHTLDEPTLNESGMGLGGEGRSYVYQTDRRRLVRHASEERSRCAEVTLYLQM